MCDLAAVAAKKRVLRLNFGSKEEIRRTHAAANIHSTIRGI